MVAALGDVIERALLGEVHMFGQQAIRDPKAVCKWASRKGARRAGMRAYKPLVGGSADDL